MLKECYYHPDVSSWYEYHALYEREENFHVKRSQESYSANKFALFDSNAPISIIKTLLIFKWANNTNHARKETQ